MKKQILLQLMCLLTCLMVSMTVGAYDFVKDGIYYTISGTNAYVTYKDTNYNSYSGTVNIPATVTNNGTTYSVVQISPSAFKNCSKLKRVVIPNSVHYIMGYAFQNCTGLTNIVIPSSVYTIYGYAFDGCTNLKSIICLGSSAPSASTSVFPSSFYGSSSSATLYVPQNYITTYQSSSLWGSFYSIKAMDCDFAEDAIFYNIVSDNTVEVTHAYRFAEDYSGDVVVPQTVTHGGTTYTVTGLGYEAFFDCYSLYTVSLPSTVTTLANYAFYDCYALTSVNVPEGVADINYCTFGECASLQSIILPSSVTWIAQNAFSGCSSLTSITCGATTPPMCSDSSCFPSNAYSNATLYVPSASLSSYQAASVWSSFHNIVGKNYHIESNGIYYIITGSNTASVTYKDTNYNSYSGSVTIPPTVTHNGVTYTVTAIGRNAFRQSSGLTAVSIPGTITAIDYASFYKCTSLTSLTIPSSVVTIGEQVFRESGLTSISIGNHVTSIGRACFYKCEGLTNVTIPNNVTEIGALCFQYSNNLQNVTLGTGLNRIPQQCFTFCESLSSVSIPSSVKVIEHFAFCETALSSVVIPEGVDSIGQLVFSSCTNLTSISFPASVKFIDYCVLEECPALATITVNSANPYYCSENNLLLSKDKTRLLQYAPAKTDRHFVIPNTCVIIDMSAFNSAANLDDITIGPNVASIGFNAFYRCTSLKAILVDAQNTHFISDDGVLYTLDNGAAQTLIQYPEARPDKHYSVLNTAESVQSSSFMEATQLQSVYIPQSVRSLGSSAFYGSSVKRVVIDEGLTTINDFVFGNCANLESVYLPSTLTSIEQQAFYRTFSLSEITFAGSTPPTLSDYVFYATGYDLENPVTVYVPAEHVANYSGFDWNSDYFTPAITQITPIESEVEFAVDSLNYTTTDALLNAKVSGVTSKNLYDPGIPPKVAYQGNLCTVTTLGYTSLQNCTRMVRAEVPFTVTWMDDYSFYGCSNIKKLRLHEGLRQIDPFSISHINALTTLTIPSSTDSISGTFVNYSNALAQILVESGNSKYTSVNGVLYTKDRKRLVAFPHALTNSYTVPSGTEVIGSSSFRGAASLDEVTLPASLKRIDGSAFFDNTGLTAIVVPNGVERVENSAFGGCTSMATAELPATLTFLGYNAFYNATALTSLTVKSSTPPTCGVYVNPRTGARSYPFIDAHYSQCTLYVPSGSKGAYQAADVWKNFLNIVEVDFPVEGVRGDVNGDGEVAIADVTALINYLLTGETAGINLVGADTNLDDEIGIADVTVLINYLLTGSWPEPAPIDMWYLWGNFIGTDIWGYTETGYDALGVSVLPLYPTGEFDARGKGILTWTGYIPRQYFTIIHTPGSNPREEMWVKDLNTGDYCMRDMNDNDPNYSSFLLDPGYYTITLNTATMTLSIEPYSQEVLSFGSITMPGYYNNWLNTLNTMSQVNTNLGMDNHDWLADEWTITSDDGYYGEVKFCAYDDWTYNWGSTDFPYGTGVNGGYNIPAKAGTYKVFFNDITGQYNFIAK